MKTTIVMTALTLALTASAQPLNNNEDRRPTGPGVERQLRGPGQPQFRGGDGALEPLNRRYGRPQTEQRENVAPSGRGNDVCPCCGARQGARQGAGYGRGPQGGVRGLRPDVQWEGRGNRGWTRFDEMNRPPVPAEGQFGRGGRQQYNAQGRSEFSPRGQGLGGPQWNEEGDRPVGPSGANGPNRGYDR